MLIACLAGAVMYRYTKATADRGIGAFASRNIQQDEFIGEYSGEIVMAADLESPERRDSEYIFDLGNQFAIDARAKGNKTRRINHAESPKSKSSSPRQDSAVTVSYANVRANVINHFGVRKVCMYAARDIAKDEELLFDYGNQYPKCWSKKRHKRGEV